jgi:hypothetical protein
MKQLADALPDSNGDAIHGLNILLDNGMREDSGMGFGMGEIEAAAKCVAQLVVDGHAHTA